MCTQVGNFVLSNPCKCWELRPEQPMQMSSSTIKRRIWAPRFIIGALLLLLLRTASAVVQVSYDCVKGTESYTGDELQEIWKILACVFDEWHGGEPVDLGVGTVTDNCGVIGFSRSILDKEAGCGSRTAIVDRSVEYCAPTHIEFQDGACIINDLEGCDLCLCPSCTSGYKTVIWCVEHDEWCEQCEAQGDTGVNCGCSFDPENFVCMADGASPGGRFGVSDIGLVEVSGGASSAVASLSIVFALVGLAMTMS